jgi:CheY-like chemotaxis protein
MNSQRLLVVDDEEINREIIAEYLDGAGYQLTLAESGAQALGLLSGGAEFDAVILDRMMPGIDGLEVLRRMQAQPRLAMVPVIMQTAAAGHEQVAEGLRLGAYYYLTKPYHRDALAAVVRSALDGVERRRELRRQIEEYRGLVGLLIEARFGFRTLKQAHGVAAAVATMGTNPAAVSLGLLELLINAVEHGNLGITFHEKAGLLASDRWEAEVEARLNLPKNLDKRVEVQVCREASQIVVRIRDQGPGFDWSQYLNLNESRAIYPNGRGIAMARHVAFTRLQYNEAGNEVAVAFPAQC